MTNDIDTDPFTIRWQVQGHPHGYFYIEVDVFLHRRDDEVVIHVTQSWLDSHPNEPGTGAECAGYARQYIDGTTVDPDDVYGHPRIERV